jgi:hypothetical protein
VTTKIFSSWQADRSTLVCRNLLERALEGAIKRLGQQADLEEAERSDLELDRDTKNVPGSPPIAETIFRKIDTAAVFVPDFTFVGSRADGRPTPNPNVLIEYGWALKALGHERVVAVMNTAFGEPSDATLPFDLRHQRHPITYHCPEDADEETRRSVREKLSKDLEQAVRLVITSEAYLSTLPQPPVPERFQPAVEIVPGRFRRPDEPVGVGEHFIEQSTAILLADRSLMWLRLMPEHDPGKTWPVSEIRQCAVTAQGHLRPLWDGFSGLSYLRAHDGFGVYSRSEGDGTDIASTVTFAFKSGEVWAVDALYLDLLSERGFSAIPDVELEYARTLRLVNDFLGRLGIEPPYLWVAGMSGLKGRGIEVPAQPGYSYVPGPKGSCMLDVVRQSGTYSRGQDPVHALKPFFDSLYEACGRSRPNWLDNRTL